MCTTRCVLPETGSMCTDCMSCTNMQQLLTVGLCICQTELDQVVLHLSLLALWHPLAVLQVVWEPALVPVIGCHPCKWTKGQVLETSLVHGSLDCWK